MSFLKNSTITLISRVFVFICSIIISVYIARLFGPGAKGIYSLLTQTASILVLMGMFGIDNAIVYSLSKNEPLKKTYANILSYTCLSSFVLLVIFYIFRKPLEATFFKNIDPVLIRITLLAVPFMFLTKLSISAVLGLNQIRQFNAFKIAAASLGISGFFILVVVLKWGLNGIMLSILFTEIFMSLAYIYFISRRTEIVFSLDIPFIKKLFNYGIRGFIGSLLLIIILKFDYYILNMFSDIRDVGFYSVSVGFGEMIFFIPEAIGVMLFPRLTSMNKNDSNLKTLQLLRFFFLALGLITLFIYIFSYKIITFIYGMQYISSAYLMRIMLPGFFAMGFYYFYFSYFYSRGRPEIITIVLALTTLVKISLSLILIPKFGAWGASLGTLLSYLICGLILIFAFLKYSGENLKSMFFITRSDIKYILSNFYSNKKKAI